MKLKLFILILFGTMMGTSLKAEECTTSTFDVYYGYAWCNYSLYTNSGMISGSEYLYYHTEFNSWPLPRTINVYEGGQNYSVMCYATTPLSQTRSITTEICTAGPLDITSHTYEFLSCTSQYQRKGILDWEVKSEATSYKLQRKIGSSWYTKYQGSGTHKMTDPLSGGSYNYRVRASNSSGHGDWHNFTINVPSCGPGGGEVPR